MPPASRCSSTSRAWLKCHEPAAFFAALLNSQPMGFYAPAQLVQDARRHGVDVRPPDVGASALGLHAGRRARCGSGLRMVGGLSQAAAERIVAARVAGDSSRSEDLARRAELDRAGPAMRWRRAVRWRRWPATVAGATGRQRACRGADGVLPKRASTNRRPRLPAPPEGEDIVADYASLGLTLGRHPLALLRPQLNRLRLLPASAVQSSAARPAAPAQPAWSPAASARIPPAA